jgi:uncharacterized protein YktA (UPF0223 family)
MTSSENKKQQDLKNGCIGCLSIFVILVVGLGACSVLFSPKEKTEEEKINNWYATTSKYSCEVQIQDRLRDPDSYKRDGDFVVSSDSGNEKVIAWRFRAKNGFGGYNASAAVCKISKANKGSVNATIVSD